MNLILAGLYLGSCRDAINENELSKNKITHIVSTHDRAHAFDGRRKQLIIKISDQERENVLNHLYEVNQFIHQARCAGGSVLVHCMLGVSRSVTFVIAYIMSVTDLGWKEALQVVRSARHRANPNFGFKRQLQLFENNCLEEERKNLANFHPQCPHDDRSFCKKAIVSYKRWVQLGDVLQDENECLLIENLASSKEEALEKKLN